jgi:hypothetical protein
LAKNWSDFAKIGICRNPDLVYIAKPVGGGVQDERPQAVQMPEYRLNVKEAIVSKEAPFLCVHSILLVTILFVCPLLPAAEYQTANFTIRNAPSIEFAAELGEAAERYRHDLALLWLGKTLPNWSARCPISVNVGNSLGPGGETTFKFAGGEVFGWDMKLQGSAKRILDSVLPHEITHTIFASHFRRPLPRWLDEGGATSVEVEAERENYRKMLVKFLQADVKRGIPFNAMFSMRDYPQDVLPLYAQGFSLAEMLINRGGHRRFITFAEAGMETGRWDEAVHMFYGYSDLGHLQTSWVQWVADGFPPQDVTVAVAAVMEPEEPLVPIRRPLPTLIATHSAASLPREEQAIRSVLLEWYR